MASTEERREWGERAGPVFLESEKAVLAAAIHGSKETQEWIVSELSPSEFARLEHQKIFGALQSILDDGLSVNPVSVADRSGEDTSELWHPELSDGQIKTLIRDIRQASQTRALARAFGEASGKCKDGRHSPDTILEALETSIYGGRLNLSKETVDAKDAAHKVVKDFLDRYEGKDNKEISTGIPALDKAVLGLRPGKLFVLGARPSMGKSALAWSIAKAVIDQGYGVIMFSLEMDAQELLERAIASYSGVNVRKIMTGKNVENGELTRVITAADAIAEGRWKIDDRTTNIGGIRRVARLEHSRMHRRGIRCGLIVLDYIQLAASGENREASVAAVSKGCKLLARELGVHVMALSQLNRGCEIRDDKRPIMADLRESGAIEQDADIVALLYRGNKYDASIPPEEAELHLAKQRGGPTGAVKLRFIPKLTLFTGAPDEPSVLGLHPSEQGSGGEPAA